MRLIDADILNRTFFSRFTSKDNAQDIVEAIEEIPTVNQWIPCSERLPEEKVRVLTCFLDGFITVNKIIDKDKLEWFRGDDVIAWMPLPKAYEEEK